MSFLSPRIDLFKFTEERSGRVYRVTNSNKSAYIGNEEYTPAAITRTSIVQSEELEKTTQEITLPLTNEMARRWIFGAARDTVSVTIFEQKGAETSALWRGVLSEVAPTESTIQLNFNDIYFSLQKKGQGVTYTRNCRHHLYSNACGVKITIPSPYVETGTIKTVEGTKLTLNSAPGKNFKGGYIKFADGSTAAVMNHSGAVITILAPSLYLAEEGSSKVVTMYVGCNKTVNDCKSKFNNVSNFGGFPWIPNLGLFDGRPIVRE